MTKGIFRRVGMMLEPADDEAREAVIAIGDGKLCAADVRGSRNPRQHSLFFALCNLVAKADDDTTENVKRWVLHETGHVDAWYDKRKGKMHIEARSIAFDSMPQNEFNQFFQIAVEKLAERLGAAPKDVMDQFNDMVSVKGYDR
jgi:hypothetical protein